MTDMKIERKRILTRGPLTVPGTDRVIEIDNEFVTKLQLNLADNVTEYVPIVAYDSYTEDPQHVKGKVLGIVEEDEEVLVEFDLFHEIDLKQFDAYPMFHLNYLNTRTGEHVGPVLLHVLLKGRPVVTGPSGL